jgi:hypothetical protein
VCQKIIFFLTFSQVLIDEQEEDEDRVTRHRRIHEPEILSDGDDGSQDGAMES